jgi:hypothetical protein
MKIDRNKEYSQNSPQQAEMDTEHLAVSPLNSVLSLNAERRTPSFSTQPSPNGAHHLFSDVCVGLLKLGQGVRFESNGCSMYPTICDGDIINVEPVSPSQVRHRDIILCRSPHGIIAHRVIHIQKETNPVLSPQSSSITGHSLSGYWAAGLLGSRDSALSTHRSSLIFYTRGDSLMSDDLPVMSDQILGKVFSVERNGRAFALCGTRGIMLQEMRLFLFALKRCVVQTLSQIKKLFLQYDSLLKKPYLIPESQERSLLIPQ